MQEDKIISKYPDTARRYPQNNFFENHSKIILSIVTLGSLLIILVLTEFTLRFFFGLGNPVRYDSNPLYGYRPLPNQEISRYLGAKLKFNNLGLRADKDWDYSKKDNKILFLGDSVTYGGSFVANNELFSTLAVNNIKGYESGNGGVNAWGVENIRGLIVESEFLPAKIYVTVLIENDFYRGITRITGQPYWCTKPVYALRELLYYYYCSEGNIKYTGWDDYVTINVRDKILEKSVIKLKELDNFLKSKGYIHLIYISPIRDQVLNKDVPQEILSTLFMKHNLDVIYLLDRIKALNLSESQKMKCYRDDWHLEKEGHIIWGEIINSDLKKILEK
jgi:hypothetical protein